MRIILGAYMVSALWACGPGGNGPSGAPATLWQLVTVSSDYATSVTTAQHNYAPADYPFGAGVNTDDSVWFNLPHYDTVSEAQVGEHLTRVWKLYPTARSLSNSTDVSFSFTISAGALTTYFWQTEADNTCSGPPASARPIVVDFFQGNVQETDEWWSAQESLMFADGGGSIQTHLTPNHWTDLYGHLGTTSAATASGFMHAISNINTFGVSFGGGCFYGHGVTTIGGTSMVTMHMSPDLN